MLKSPISMLRHTYRIGSQQHWKGSLKFGRTPVRTVKTSTVDWKPIHTAKTPNEEMKKKSFVWGRRIFLLLMFGVPTVSFYLGTWQLRRLKWKTKLIADCEDRLAMDPVPLPKNFTPDMCEDWEYKRVTIKGGFLHEEELFVGPRIRNGVKGYVLFTPFIRKDTGQKLLLERGWVSEDNVVPTARKLQHLSLPKSDNVELTCIVRVPSTLGTFQWEKEDKDSRLWQVADMPALFSETNTLPVHLQALYDMHDHHWDAEAPVAASIDGSSPWWKVWSNGKQEHSTKQVQSSPAPIFDPDLEFNELQFVEAGVPIGIVPKVNIRNTHLQYLFTWFGLSFISTIFLIFALRRSSGAAVSPTQLKKDKLKHLKKFT